MSSPTISSNTLFHFTNNREHLINILTNNFCPRYCLENFKHLYPSIKKDVALVEFAFPMACFCDIPLSNIGSHLKIYGNYGIGLTKEWGKRKGLNPILYVHKESALLKSLDKLGDEIVNTLGSKVILKEHPEVVKALVTARFYYLKPYEGDFLRNDKIIPNVRFYDEREWRYVPEVDLDYYHLEKSEYADSVKRKDANDSLPDSIILEFTPDDIRYIIVEKESEILKMVDEVLQIKGDNYTYNQLKILSTRIISAEQIREDF